MNWLGELIQQYITQDDSVLDLGCGIMNAVDELELKSMLGLDIWGKYLDHIKDKFPTVRMDMSETDRFMNKSYDIVICLDVVEHLDKQLALKVIDECKRICRKKAIIYTPKEFLDNKESVVNSWGLGENPHQIHKCLIDESDFMDRDYRVNILDEGMLGVYEC